jgi:hypothetical protein
MRHAVIRDGVVIAIVAWNPGVPWELPPGCVLVASETAAVGEAWGDSEPPGAQEHRRGR